MEEDYAEPEPSIGWAWFEREPIERLDEIEEALHFVARNDWIDDGMAQRQDPVPEKYGIETILGGAATKLRILVDLSFALSFCFPLAARIEDCLQRERLSVSSPIPLLG